MEKAYGRVVALKDNMAEVEIARGAMCGESCSNCGMCEKRQSKVMAKNTLNASVGDSVELGVSTSKGLKAAVLVYMVPVMILIISLVVMLWAGISEEMAIVCSFLIMALWFIGVFTAEKKGAFKDRILAEITKINK